MTQGIGESRNRKRYCSPSLDVVTIASPKETLFILVIFTLPTNGLVTISVCDYAQSEITKRLGVAYCSI